MPNLSESNLNAVTSIVASIMHDNEAAELMTRENPLITIQTLFHNGKSIDHRGRTLLHFAAMVGHTPSVKWLLQQSSIDVNAKDNQGQTPLHLSVSKSHHQITTLLLSNKALQIPDKDGDMPMHLLSIASSTKMFRLLHQHKGNVSAENKKGKTPFQLIFSVTPFNEQLAAEFLIKGAALLNTGESLEWINLFEEFQDNPLVQKYIFLAACSTGNIQVVEQMLEKNPELSKSKDCYGNTMFLIAAANGQIEFAQWLLDNNHAKTNEINKKGMTAFLCAAAYGQIKFAQWLLDNNYAKAYEQNKKGTTAFLFAAAYGQIEFAQWLLDNNHAKADEITFNGTTAFLCAATCGQIEFAQWLLDNNYASANEKNEKGMTAFLFAAAYGQIEFAKWLFDNNHAIADEINNYGATAFLCAAVYGQIEFAQWLLDNNFAKANEKDNRGATAFQCAAAYGRIKFAQWLLDNNHAKANEKDHKGSSAFLYTAVYGQIEFAQWLINNHYARPDEKNSDGKTAFALAAFYQKIDYVKWLLIEGHIPQTGLITLFKSILSWISKDMIKTSNGRIIQETIDYCIKQNILESLEINFIDPIIKTHRAFITPLTSYFENFIQEYINNNNFTVALKLAIIAIGIDPVKFIKLSYKVMDIVQDQLLTPLNQKTDCTVSNEELLKKAFTTWQEYIDIFKQNNSHGADLLYADFYSSLGEWKKAFDLYNGLVNKCCERHIKKEASLSLAEMLINGHIFFKHNAFNDELSHQEIPKIIEGDNKTQQEKKLKLMQEILQARAIQAYEYVAPYRKNNTISFLLNRRPDAGSQLLNRLHQMLAGKDSVEAGQDPNWLPSSIEKFTQYYGKRSSSFGYEYIRQISLLTVQVEMARQRELELNKKIQELEAKLQFIADDALPQNENTAPGFFRR